MMPVSEFLHGECGVELLVNACMYLAMENVTGKRKNAICLEYEKGYLEKLGISCGDGNARQA